MASTAVTTGFDPGARMKVGIVGTGGVARRTGCAAGRCPSSRLPHYRVAAVRGRHTRGATDHRATDDQCGARHTRTTRESDRRRDAASPQPSALMARQRPDGAPDYGKTRTLRVSDLTIKAQFGLGMLGHA